MLRLALFPPPPQEYRYEVKQLDLGRFGKVDYARWMHPGWTLDVPSEALVAGLRQFIAEGDVCLDIGAHQGDTAVPIALACGASGAVIALEPNPHVFPVLEENSRLNPDRQRIVPLPFAATPTDGPVTFWYSDPGFHNGGSHAGLPRWRHSHMMPLTVEGRAIVPLLERECGDLIGRLRYVKVDAEGADLQILYDLRPLLMSRRPHIRAEVFRKYDADHRREMHDFLTGLGYDVFRYVEPQIFGERLGRDDMLKAKTFDIIAAPRQTAGPRPA